MSSSISMENLLHNFATDEEIKAFTDEKDERSELDSFNLFSLKDSVKTLHADNSNSNNIDVSTRQLDPGLPDFQKYVQDVRNSVGVRLPQLTLPQFDVNCLKWTEFWDLYSVTIHEHNQISNAQKLAYLRGQLHGKALEAIQGFKQVEANYEAVVDTLKNRFGKSRLIAKEHIKQILSLDETGQKDLGRLCRFRDTIESNIRSLKEMKLDSSTSPVCDIFLLTLFEQNLSGELLRQWEFLCVGKTDDELTVALLVEFLSAQISVLEATNNGEKRKEEKWDSQSRRRQSFQKKAGSEEQSWKSTILNAEASNCAEIDCAFCNGAHNVNDPCVNMYSLSQEAILQKAYDLHVCTKCFSKKKHYAKNCNAKICCRICKKTNHHTLMHNVSFKKFSEKKKTVEPSSNEEEKAQGLACQRTGRSSVLLQSALCILRLPDGRSVEVRILIDPGATDSFVKQDLVESLGITGTTENISVKVLGGKELKAARRKVVKLSSCVSCL